MKSYAESITEKSAQLDISFGVRYSESVVCLITTNLQLLHFEKKTKYFTYKAEEYVKKNGLKVSPELQISTSKSEQMMLK